MSACRRIYGANRNNRKISHGSVLYASPFSPLRFSLQHFSPHSPPLSSSAVFGLRKMEGRKSVGRGEALSLFIPTISATSFHLHSIEQRSEYSARLSRDCYSHVILLPHQHGLILSYIIETARCIMLLEIQILTRFQILYSVSN